MGHAGRFEEWVFKIAVAMGAGNHTRGVQELQGSDREFGVSRLHLPCGELLSCP